MNLALPCQRVGAKAHLRAYSQERNDSHSGDAVHTVVRMCPEPKTPRIGHWTDFLQVGVSHPWAAEIPCVAEVPRDAGTR